MVVRKESNFDVKLKDADDVTEKYNHQSVTEKDSAVVFYFKSFVFISISVLLVRFYDLHNIVYEQFITSQDSISRLTRPGFFWLGTFATVAYTLIFLYIWLYWSKIRNVPIEYDKLKQVSPFLIPTATALILLSGLSFCVAFYSVVGVLTPIVLFLVYLGAISFISLIF